MGKSLKNAVTPDEMYDAYGADTLRIYEMSMGPMDASRPWETRAVPGAYRLLQRIWRNLVDEDSGAVRVVDHEAQDRAVRGVEDGQREDVDLPFREAESGRDMAKYRAYLHGQVRELLTNYGQIDVLWLDFSYSWRDWGWSKGKGADDWGAHELLEMVRDLQPNVLVNNRSEVRQDFFTPEQYQPRAWMHVDGAPVMWEACQTLNGSWGYDRDNLDWKSPGMLIRMLADGVSKGGNLLLNVGPTARGEFDPRARATLAAVGSWMHHHARAIRGCTQAPADLPAPPDCEIGRAHV